MSLTTRWVATALVVIVSGVGVAAAQELIDGAEVRGETEFDSAIVTAGGVQETSTEASVFSESLVDLSARAFAPVSYDSHGCLFTCGNRCGKCGKCKVCTHAGPQLTVYGFGQADYIQDFDRVAPAWNATLRPSRIPTKKGLFGSDGEALVSARQSRFGVKGKLPTSSGEVRTMFEFDLFGVGIDEGQTTIRLRHAYGEFGSLLGGQTHSLFMDIDVFPNVIDYWGPAGMVFLRTPQLRWQPVRGDNYFAVALEFPDEAIDTGVFNRIIEDAGVDVEGVTRMPDFTVQFRANRDWGHFQAAGIVRRIGFDTLDTVDNRPKEDFTAWGINLSSVLQICESDRAIFSFVTGEGIASYMNDGGVDLAPTSSVPPSPVATVPLRGYVAYYDRHWSDRWSSSIGYSRLEFDNLGGQTAKAYKGGDYASVNLLHYPNDRVMYGIEFLWGQREDRDGATGVDRRIQTSFKYSF